MAPKEQRLTKQKDFRGVFSQGKSVREGQLVFRARSVGSGPAKFGIVVSKKVAKQAVVRNRIRRILREALWRETEQVQEGIQGVVVVLPGFHESTPQELQKTVHRLLQKASAFQ